MRKDGKRMAAGGNRRSGWARRQPGSAEGGNGRFDSRTTCRAGAMQLSSERVPAVSPGTPPLLYNCPLDPV